MTSLKLVIDTNILTSAALSAQGSPAKLVLCAMARHRLVFSQTTFDELRTRIYRPKFDRYICLDDRERLLRDFSAVRFGWSRESLGSIAVIAMTTISLKLH